MVGLGLAVFLGTLAFGLAIGSDVFVVAIARTRHVETIRAVYERAAALNRWIGPLFGFAIVLGDNARGRFSSSLAVPRAR